MDYGHIPGIDKPISRLVQGTLHIKDASAPVLDLLDGALELGCTAFDTGHVYSSGDCERSVGRWVNSRGIRDRVVIIAKGAHHNADRRRVTPWDITADLYDSLARFKFDSIDLYLLHRDDPSVPVEPIVDVLNEHLQAGRIHAFGGSNWSHERLGAANDYARAQGLVPFVASSPQFSLGEQARSPWPDCISIAGASSVAARAWYQQTGMPVLAWSSLAGGFFSGRFRRDNLDTFTDYFDKVCVDTYCTEANFQRLDRVRALADELGMTVAQVALAYVMNQPFTTFPIVGCHTAAEFKAALDASALKLDTATLAWLDLRSDSRG